MKKILVSITLLTLSAPILSMARTRVREEIEVNDHQIKTRSLCFEKFFAGSLEAYENALKEKADLLAQLHELEHGWEKDAVLTKNGDCSTLIGSGLKPVEEILKLKIEISLTLFSAYEECLKAENKS